jgi:rubredoxin
MAKMIKCPKCGNVFKKPIFGRKRVGVGIGFTAMGDYIKCPECGYEAIPGEFEAVQQ